MSDTQRYARVDRHQQKRVRKAGLGGASSDVTRQRLIPLIYYSERVFQGYAFENSRDPCDQFHPADQQDDMSSQSQVSERAETPEKNPLADMIFVPGGEFRMGSDGHYPEEAPEHRVSVGAFWVAGGP